MKEKDEQLPGHGLEKYTVFFSPIKTFDNKTHPTISRDDRQTRSPDKPAPVRTVQDLFRSYLIYVGWTPAGETLRCTAAGPLQQMGVSHLNDSISLMQTAVPTVPHLILAAKSDRQILPPILIYYFM